MGVASCGDSFDEAVKNLSAIIDQVGIPRNEFINLLSVF